MNGFQKRIILAAAFTLVNALVCNHDLDARSSQRFGKAAPEPPVNHRLAVGLTYHKAHSDFKALPFQDGDLSYGLYYEYHEGIGYWLMGADITPSIQDNAQIDRVITPRLSLIVKDRFYRAGIGVLKSYISDKEDLIDDTDLYYQLSLGLHLPLFNRIGLDLNTLYSLEKWRDIDFEFKDLEFGLMVDYMF